ncbi:condensation domain-containing protein, partial [Aliikangiella sp. G2MR2-5]|uniref:condensation domain-containing protein n=1 Tax=Aliikangiella sp. G2MR2-5 TaxID=2788943 RepID=UPI001FED6EA0
TDIFLKELAAFYQAQLSGDDVELAELELTYGDYAKWQREYLQGETLKQLQEYWQQALSGYETLQLPLDKARPSTIDYRGNDVDFILDEQLSEQLRKLAQQQETTLYSVLLSAFYVTLTAWTGQQDVVVGTPSDGRHLSQVQSLIGFFINSLVLRAETEPSLSVSSLISQVHETVLSAKSHQDLPFEQLVELLGVERDSSRHPLFQVMFGVQNFGESFTEYEGLPFEPLNLTDEQRLYRSAKTDLSLFISDGDSSLTGSFTYAVSLFEKVTITRLKAIYCRVLKAFVADSSQALHEIEVLSQQERETLLYRWNDT